jgi:hypothetical protein
MTIVACLLARRIIKRPVAPPLYRQCTSFQNSPLTILDSENMVERCVCVFEVFLLSINDITTALPSCGVVSSINFHDVNIIEDLAGNHIHRLENIASMNCPFHSLFNELYLWLKPVEVSLHLLLLCIFISVSRTYNTSIKCVWLVTN